MEALTREFCENQLMNDVVPSTAIDPRFDPVDGPVVATFVRYAIPSVLGMLAVTSAGIIDGIFLDTGSSVGVAALAAILWRRALLAASAAKVRTGGLI